MLNLVTDGEQIITKDMLHYYDEIPKPLRGEYSRIIVGVDLAISESDRADFTAILVIDVIGSDEKQRMYVRPYPINKRMNFPSTVAQLREVSDLLNYPRMYIEQTAYQAAVVQELTADGFDVQGVSPRSDKSARLSMISDKISRGIILFPKHGIGTLVSQLVNFGSEKHDDLVDALTMAVIEFHRDKRRGGKVTFGRASDIFGPGWRGGSRPSRGSRDYWSRRLDDFEEATSGKWD